MDLINRGKKIAAAKKEQTNKYQGGNVPFGFKKTDDGYLEKHTEAYNIIVNIKKEVKENGKLKKSTREIAKLINGISDEINISHTTVWRIIKKANL